MKVKRSEVEALLEELGFGQASEYDDTRMINTIHKLSDVVDPDVEVENVDLLDDLLEAVEAEEDIELEDDTKPKKSSRSKSKSKSTRGKSKSKAKEEEEDEDLDEEEEDLEDDADEEDEEDEDADEEEEAPPKKSSRSRAKSKSKAATKSTKATSSRSKKKGVEPPAGRAKKRATSSSKKASSKSTKSGNKPETLKKVGVISTIIECLSKATKTRPLSREDLLEKLTKQFPDRSADGMKKTISQQVPKRLKSDKNIDVEQTSNGKFYIDTRNK